MWDKCVCVEKHRNTGWKQNTGKTGEQDVKSDGTQKDITTK